MTKDDSGDVMEPKPTWIRGHYHCPKCGGVMECWKSFNWDVRVGVSRMGGCILCKRGMMEFEKVPPKGFDLPK